MDILPHLSAWPVCVCVWWGGECASVCVQDMMFSRNSIIRLYYNYYIPFSIALFPYISDLQNPQKTIGRVIEET